MGILMINKITSVLTSKLINLSGEISSSLIFNFIDQLLPFNLIITGLNFIETG